VKRHRDMQLLADPRADREPMVFVVDDDVSVRESLELLIRQAGLRSEIFATAEAFLAHPRTHSPRCLVLDVSLPDLNGLDLQRILAVDQQYMPIIFITGHGDVPMTVKAMKAGAFEFLTKPFEDGELLSAIQNAIGRSLSALAHEEETQMLHDRYAALTSREREVMALVVSGYLNKQIANELSISEITVKAHRGKLMRKMDAESLADLVKMDAKLRPPT
jgi:FixJ family two-component response regulator